MAEIFGTVASAVSVAALFNNCVECFEYIQLGRHFGRDYNQCQLKLDIAKVRLDRWGQAVAINTKPEFATDMPADGLPQEVFAILEEIQLLFQSLYKSSKRYEINAGQEDLERFREEDMQPVPRRLHSRLKAIARHRQKNTSLAKKVAWALYDGKNFDKLLRNIAEFVDDLEKLCPVEARMVEMEIQEVEDEPSLLALQGAAADIDPVLSEVVTEKIESIAGKNHVKDIKGEGKATVRVGNEWHETALRRETAIGDRTPNTAGYVAVKDTARVHVGHSYGGKGIFDS